MSTPTTEPTTATTTVRIHPSTIVRLAQDAQVKVKQKRAFAWWNAIEKAKGWLATVETVTLEGDSLLVPSRTYHERQIVYRANHICQCKAFTDPQGTRPCWHRAAGRLVEIYVVEHPQAVMRPPTVEAQAPAPAPAPKPVSQPRRKGRKKVELPHEPETVQEPPIELPAPQEGSEPRIPLYVGSEVVGYADTPGQATQWVEKFENSL